MRKWRGSSKSEKMERESRLRKLREKAEIVDWGVKKVRKSKE